jgi:hypothetical protein
MHRRWTVLDGTVIAKMSLDLLSNHNVLTRSQSHHHFGRLHPNALVQYTAVPIKLCKFRGMMMVRPNSVASVIGYGDVPRQFLTRNCEASTRLLPRRLAMARWVSNFYLRDTPAGPLHLSIKRICCGRSVMFESKHGPPFGKNKPP